MNLGLTQVGIREGKPPNFWHSQLTERPIRGERDHPAFKTEFSREIKDDKTYSRHFKRARSRPRVRLLRLDASRITPVDPAT